MNRSVVVTGGARGIGRGIAERMVARGHRVVITDIDGEAAAATAARSSAADGLRQDVSDPGSHREVAAAAARHGVLAAWFNNAGVGDDGNLEDLTEAQVRRLVDVNLLGTLWGMRAAIEAFGSDGGDIVNTASLSGLGPVPGYSVYAATKAAIVSASMSVDAETAAQHPGARALPRRRPDRDARRPDRRARSPPGWSTPAAGSSPSTRSPRRRSTSSAATASCSPSRAGAGP